MCHSIGAYSSMLIKFEILSCGTLSTIMFVDSSSFMSFLDVHIRVCHNMM